MIDLSINFYDEVSKGKDPDFYSPTLRKYHQQLWSKPLPNGKKFILKDVFPKGYLLHESQLGYFPMGSDSISHSYTRVKSMEHVIKEIPNEDIESFFNTCCSIGGYLIFPRNRIDNKMTINGARGCNRKIKDRFDLTLECIRRLYANEKSPLSDVLERYHDFFKLFRDFRGYVDFFLLQDLVSEDYSRIKFYIPFQSFDDSALPDSVDKFITYKSSITSFVKRRNNRMMQVYL